MMNINHKAFISILLFFIFAPLICKASYYPSSYLDSRKSFREWSQKVIDQHPLAESGLYHVPSKIDQDLTTDYLYIPPEGLGEKLLVITSGMHGVESFTGSAIQHMFIKDVFPTLNRENLGILIVHALNPYGFKYHRRVTENNVDLNRNFILNRDSFKDSNSKYKMFYDFLNPSKEASISFFSKYMHIFKTLYYVVRHGKPSFRQAILQGQYKHEKGIYYGGKENEPQVLSFYNLLQKYSSEYKSVFAIDLHTGYGERGTLHFFGLGNYDKTTSSYLEKVFKGYQIDGGSEGNFYTVTGDLTAFVAKALKDKIVIPMTFEYGTLDSQTTLGAIESLRRSIRENQAFHFGGDKKVAQSDFLNMFNPPEMKWREKILSDSQVVFKDVIKNYISLKLPD